MMNEDNEYADVYVLVKGRRPTMIAHFLDSFLPDRVENADEYEIPYGADNPQDKFDSAEMLMSYLVDHPNEKSMIYWRSVKRSNPHFAMVFYTDDGNMIFGLSYDDQIDEHGALHCLEKFLSSQHGYVCYEDIPPMNTDEFINYGEMKCSRPN